MTDTPEFISFHDRLTDKYHTASWAEAQQAMQALQAELGRRPTRDELLLRLIETKGKG